MNKATMKGAVKKTVLCLAVTAALGTSAVASASTINFNWSGLFTMLNPAGGSLSGTPFKNTSYKTNAWKGYRTAVSGTMSFNTATGSGTGTVGGFLFQGTQATATGINFQSIGNGICKNNDPAQGCGAGTLVLGNMLFNWNGNNGIPVSLVMDAQGLFGAMQSPTFGVGTTISGTGATPASNNMSTGAYKIGPAPIATTTWNTTTCTGAGMNSNPSGCLPLIADAAVPAGYSPSQTGIGGSPMIAGPFTGFNANFDVTSMTVTSISAVPVPAAVWLLGSGLLGLVGVARRKRSDQI